jgi:hypothetical protein
MLLVTAPVGELFAGCESLARAAAVQAGAPVADLCPGAAPLQAASPPHAAIAPTTMMPFNNDPESARIDPLRIIAVKCRSIHCSYRQQRRSGHCRIEMAAVTFRYGGAGVFGPGRTGAQDLYL